MKRILILGALVGLCSLSLFAHGLKAQDVKGTGTKAPETKAQETKAPEAKTDSFRSLFLAPWNGEQVKNLYKKLSFLPHPSQKSVQALVLIPREDPRIFFLAGLYYGSSLAGLAVPETNELKETLGLSLDDFYATLEELRAPAELQEKVMSVKRQLKDETNKDHQELYDLLLGIGDPLVQISKRRFADAGEININFGIWYTICTLQLRDRVPARELLEKSRVFSSYLKANEKSLRVPEKKMANIRQAFSALDTLLKRSEPITEKDMSLLSEALDDIPLNYVY